MDTSTIKVYVKGPTDSGNGIEYTLANNIFEVTGISNIYLIQEVQDEKFHELRRKYLEISHELEEYVHSKINELRNEIDGLEDII